MGEAKRRGTFEERKLCAMRRQKAEHKIKTEVTETPEPKLNKNFALALMLSLGMMDFPGIVDRDREHNFKLQYRRH